MSSTVSLLLNYWWRLHDYNDDYECICHFLSSYLKAPDPMAAYLHADSCHLHDNIMRWVFPSQRLVNLWLWGSVNLSKISKHINGKTRIWTRHLCPQVSLHDSDGFQTFSAMKSTVSAKSYVEACNTAKIRIDLCLTWLQNHCSTSG